MMTSGIQLESRRVSAFAAGGETGLRVCYPHGAVLTVTRLFRTDYVLPDLRVTQKSLFFTQSRFDKELSCFDNHALLLRQGGYRILKQRPATRGRICRESFH